MDVLSTKLQFFVDLTIIQSKIKRTFDARLGINGVGLDDFIILYVLSNSTDYQMERVELAIKIGLTTADLTRKLPSLEKIGLIEREDNPEDIKKSKIRITEAGKKVYVYATESAQEKAIDLFPFRNNKELEGLIEVLNSIHEVSK